MSRSHPLRIPDYLAHILEAIDRATGYIKAMPNAAAFEQDGLTQDAVVRCIEIIGEAATKILKADPAFVAAHPEIAWQQMSAMRNRVIHNYFDVDYEVVWRTVMDDLPGLAERIKAIPHQA